MKRKVIIFLLFIFLATLSSARAAGIYPYSFNSPKIMEGGQILFSSDSNENSYFIKSGFLGEDAAIYKFAPSSIAVESGQTIDNSRIMASLADAGHLYLLLQTGDSLFLAIYGKELISKIYLSSSPEATSENSTFLGQNGNILLRIASNLYYFEFENLAIKKINLLSEECLSFTFFSNNKENFIAFVEDNHENCSFNVLDSKGLLLHKQFIPYSESIFIGNTNNFIALQLGSKTNDNSLIYLLNPKNYLVENSFWLEAPLMFTSFSAEDQLYYLTYNNSQYQLISKSLSSGQNIEINRKELSRNLVEPLYIGIIGDYLIIVFKNGVVTYFLNDLAIRSVDFFPVTHWFQEINDVAYYNDKLYLSSQNYSVILYQTKNDFWLVKSFFYEFWKYIIPLFLLLLLALVFSSLRHHSRLINTLMDLPATGLLFIIDKSGRLIQLNELARVLLAIKGNTPLKRRFNYYFKLDTSNPLIDFYEQNSSSKDTVSKKINLGSSKNEKEWLCHLVPVRNIAGASRGVILTAIDITEHLERKRLTNWAQLAHDMQTNLSTVRLNAEHLEVIENDNNKSRQKKILHQVNILLQRIRDVITVGRSDELDISLVHSSEICLDVRSEFDEIVFPDVNFELDIHDFLFKCDRQKLIRALRNAVENGIRALPQKKGVVTIGCYRDGKNSYFSIKDTGQGMNKETREKFLTPYFTTQSGSGGSGIGTMIMLRVAELHGGKLQINSIEGTGTEVVFVLPNR